MVKVCSGEQHAHVCHRFRRILFRTWSISYFVRSIYTISVNLLRRRHTMNYGDRRENRDQRSHVARSLKVIETGTHQSAMYDFISL